MNHSDAPRSLHEAEARIGQIDFSMVALKLVDRTHGLGWAPEHAERAVARYRRFLALAVTHIGPMVPTREIDEVWHTHILDTRAYAADCEQAFGFVLHHFPYLGMRGPEDEAQLELAFKHSAETYKAAFGEEYESQSGACSGGGGSCRGCSNR